MRIAIVLFVTALCLVAPTFALTGQEIAEKAYDVYRAGMDSFDDYVKTYETVMKDDDGDEMQRYIAKEYFKQPDNRYYEVSEFYKDGKKEEAPDFNEGEPFDLKFPFWQDYFDDYNYKYRRTEILSGKECYVVGITGMKKSEGYIKGTMWIETGSYDIVKSYSELYKQPKHVSESNMTMYFKKYDGHIMIRKLKFYANTSFLLFFKKKIYVTETVSGYKFNVGLSDGLFE